MSKWLRVILPVLTVFSLLFIFSNSLQASSDVEKTKGRVLQVVEEVVEAFVGKDVSFEKLKGAVLSKIGHMLEYTVFSFLFTFSVYYRRGEKEREAFYQILFACTFAALADEHLQMIGVGRNPALSDVLVDFSACLIGFALGGLVFSFLERRRNQRERNTSAS